MRCFILVFLNCFVIIAIYSQNNIYKISYNKHDDKLIYQQQKNRKGIESWEVKSKKPSLINGDKIILEINNYNVFYYDVEIKKQTFKIELNNDYENPINLIFDLIPSYLSKIQSGNDQIKKLGESTFKSNSPKLSNENRSELSLIDAIESTNNLLYSVEHNNSFLLTSIQKIELLIKDRNAIHFNFQNLCKEIKTELGKLEIVDNIELINSIEIVKEKIESDSNKKAYSDLINKYEAIKLNIINQSNYSNEYIKQESDKLNKILDAIDQTNFLKEETFEADSNLSQVIFEFSFIPKEMNYLQKTKIEKKQTVWYFDKFKNTKTNKIENTNCSECEQIVSAKGMYAGTLPDSLKNLENNIDGFPVGNWKFFNIDGSLKSEVVFNVPEIDKINNVKIVKEKTIFSALKYKSGMKSTITLGIGGINVKSEVKEYTRLGNGDSINIIGVGNGKIIPVVMTQLRFETNTIKNIKFGIAFGGGYSLNKGSDMHFSIGPTLRLGNLEQANFTFGLSLIRIERLHTDLVEGKNFGATVNKYNSLTKNIITPGLYFGFMFDL